MNTESFKKAWEWIREWYKLILALGCLGLFSIFLLKNADPAEVWLFGWTLDLPLIVIAFVCFAIGWLCGWIFSTLYRKRKQDKSQSVI
ncbi:DUF1049 domain-containing protein [bacterium]|nr:DUF1049 domain-containing protein [bacterium]